MSIHNMLGPLLSVLQVLSHFILTVPPLGRYYYYPHFIEKKTEIFVFMKIQLLSQVSL